MAIGEQKNIFALQLTSLSHGGQVVRSFFLQ